MSHPRRQGHEALHLRHHRPRGHVPHAQQQALRHATSSPASRPARGAGRRGHPGLQHVPQGRGRDGREHRDGLRAAAVRRRLDPRGRRRRHRADHRITEGIPAHDELRVYNHLKQRTRHAAWSGPNCPGILSPGKANVGIIPASFFTEGNVGVVSRSGTLTYQIGNELAQKGFGNSTHRRHRRRPGPRHVVHRRARAVRGRRRDRAHRDGRRDRRLRRGGGGRVHRRRTSPSRSSPTSPASRRPPGKTMGHAGAIVSGSSRHRRGQEGGARGRAACASASRRPRSPRSPPRSPARWRARFPEPLPVRALRARAALGRIGVWHAST